MTAADSRAPFLSAGSVVDVLQSTGRVFIKYCTVKYFWIVSHEWTLHHSLLVIYLHCYVRHEREIISMPWLATVNNSPSAMYYTGVRDAMCSARAGAQRAVVGLTGRAKAVVPKYYCHTTRLFKVQCDLSNTSVLVWGSENSLRRK